MTDVDQGLDDGAVSPNVGPAQVGHAHELDLVGCGVCAHAWRVQR